jgi:hypothetical protein
MLELRQSKVGNHPAEHGGSTPDVTALASQVPSGRVEQTRGEVDHGDLRDIVRSTTHTRAQGTKTHRRRLGNNGVRDGSLGARIDKGDDDAEAGLGVVGGVGLVDGGADAEDEEEDDVGEKTPEVNRTPAKPGRQEPREDVGDEPEARVDEVELEGLVGRDAGLCRLSQY